jgi:hypothetical protein
MISLLISRSEIDAYKVASTYTTNFLRVLYIFFKLGILFSMIPSVYIFLHRLACSVCRKVLWAMKLLDWVVSVCLVSYFE